MPFGEATSPLFEPRRQRPSGCVEGGLEPIHQLAMVAGIEGLQAQSRSNATQPMGDTFGTAVPWNPIAFEKTIEKSVEPMVDPGQLVGAQGARGLERGQSFEGRTADRFETLPARGPDPLAEPDASFVLVSDSVVFDRDTDSVTVVSRPLPEVRGELGVA